jgi:hypothetical protein
VRLQALLVQQPLFLGAQQPVAQLVEPAHDLQFGQVVGAVAFDLLNVGEPLEADGGDLVPEPRDRLAHAAAERRVGVGLRLAHARQRGRRDLWLAVPFHDRHYRVPHPYFDIRSELPAPMSVPAA